VLRIPLIRSGDDETPIRWWEWLFAPAIMPLIFILLLFASVLSVPVEWVNRFLVNRHENKLRQRLIQNGRFLEWPSLEPLLTDGGGTLIIEHQSLKGPIREWFTPDDIIESSPMPLPTSIKMLKEDDEPLQDYARKCAKQYVDEESGTATLTELPNSLSKRTDPRKYVVVKLWGGWMSAILLPTGRNIAEQYPNAKVVTLLMWSEEKPFILQGDAEACMLDAA